MSIDYESIKTGTMVRVDPQNNLLISGDGDVGRVTQVNLHSVYRFRVSFEISKEVLLYKREIIEVLDREIYPEHYL